MAVPEVPKILIVGGGYAGFYTAWKLEKHLRRREAEVTMVDPLPYLTYQPFLPEVVGGSIEERFVVVSQRRHLKRTRVLTAKITKVDHEAKVATAVNELGDEFEIEYDVIVMTAGSVSRTFPIPGVADFAIGLKSVEEAAWIRDRIIRNFSTASTLEKGDPRRERLLTYTVVGGGFAGIEAIAEMRSLVSAMLRQYPEIEFEETKFHLIEAMGRVMPEVSLKTSEKVLKSFAQRGILVHLDTQLQSCVDGFVEMSDGQSFESDVIVWTAGVMATPMLRDTGLPLDPRGRLTVRADLRVVDGEEIVPDAWGAGDNTAVPDLTGGGVGGFTVPNAQHAVRQAKRLAKNIVAVLRGEQPVDYYHKNLGAVAGLGVGYGVFQSGKLAFTGFIGWVIARGYHGLAIPTWERKWRVIFGWLGQFLLGRDFVSLDERTQPRDFFERYASRPKPKVEEPKVEAAAEPEKVAVEVETKAAEPTAPAESAAESAEAATPTK